MLCLRRQPGESVIIDGGIEVKIVEQRGGRIVVGVDAPEHIKIVRKELLSESSAPASGDEASQRVAHGDSASSSR